MFKKYKSQLLNPLLFCVVPGLLPFSAEPHIVGKVRWVMGGAMGMQPMDYFDLFLHGSPFVYLAYVLIKMLKESLSPNA
ncbi:MAG: hypothetical protein ACO3L1_02935 [Flavobacteriaceae bacterium]